MKGIDLKNLTDDQKKKLQELRGKRYTKEQQKHQELLLKRKKTIIDYVSKNDIKTGRVSYNEIICKQRRTRKDQRGK